ncbi:MAG: alpha/beta hydrolase [Fibrobacterota bacterium]
MKDVSRYIPVLIGTFLFVAGAWAVKFDFIVNHLAFHPSKHTLSQAGVDTIPNICRKYIDTRDGERLEAAYIENPSSPYITIFFHGNAGAIADRIDFLQTLAQQGTSVLGVGYRGYGASTGKPSEDGVYTDGRAAVEYALDSLGYTPDKILLCGRSIGTAVAVKTALIGDVRGVILISPISTAREYAAYHDFGIFAFFAGSSFPISTAIESLTVPLLVIHGTADRILPFEMGRKIFRRAASEQKDFVGIEEGTHNGLEYEDSELFWGSISAFISQHR